MLLRLWKLQFDIRFNQRQKEYHPEHGLKKDAESKSKEATLTSVQQQLRELLEQVDALQERDRNFQQVAADLSSRVPHSRFLNADYILRMASSEVPNIRFTFVLR